MSNYIRSGDIGEFVRELEDYVIFGEHEKWVPRVADFGRQFGEVKDKTFLFRTCGEYHSARREHEDDLMTDDSFRVARNKIIDDGMKRVYLIAEYAVTEQAA